MKFDPAKSLEILERTPAALELLLNGLSDDWTTNNEGGESWSVYDVIGHFVHGERTDWMARMEIILSGNSDKTFAPFDRFAQFHESKGKTLAMLLEEFKTLRRENLGKWRSKGLTAADYSRTGIHPVFGEVTLSQLISTWAVHDLNHLSQIARVMAHQYKTEVGPWYEYLPLLQPRNKEA